VSFEESHTMIRPAVAFIVLLCACAWPGQAAAQQVDLQAAQDVGRVEAPSLSVRMTAPANNDGLLPRPIVPTYRGSVLPSMYVGLVGLQVYDGYSTNRGLKNGASESNAVLGMVSEHPAAVWAIKGGTAFASILVAERLWRANHRGQAIALMAVSNGVMAVVAANNAAILRRQK
jgi:hypothetical protein